MKAKARFFTLLIGMISMVGFGNTTDPDQNSIVTQVDSLKPVTELLSVNQKTSPLQLANVFKSVASEVEFEIVISNDSVASFGLVSVYKSAASKEELFNASTVKEIKTVQLTNHFPDVGNMVRIDKSNYNKGNYPEKVPEAPGLIYDKLKLVNVDYAALIDEGWINYHRAMLEGNRKAREGISCTDNPLTI